VVKHKGVFMKKQNVFLLASLLTLGLVFVSCEDSFNIEGGGYTGGTTPTTPITRPASPTGVKSTTISSDYDTITKHITWNTVPDATRYNVYYALAPDSIGLDTATRYFAGSVTSPPLIFTFNRPDYNHYTSVYQRYWVKAVNSAGESN
jgi:hypothetical protein